MKIKNMSNESLVRNLKMVEEEIRYFEQTIKNIPPTSTLGTMYAVMSLRHSISKREKILEEISVRGDI